MSINNNNIAHSHHTSGDNAVDACHDSVNPAPQQLYHDVAHINQDYDNNSSLDVNGNQQQGNNIDTMTSSKTTVPSIDIHNTSDNDNDDSAPASLTRGLSHGYGIRSSPIVSLQLLHTSKQHNHDHNHNHIDNNITTSLHTLATTKQYSDRITRELHNHPLSRMAYHHKADYEYNRVSIQYAPHNVLPEHKSVSQSLIKAMKLRRKFLFNNNSNNNNRPTINVFEHLDYKPPNYKAFNSIPSKSPHKYKLINGVYYIFANSVDDQDCTPSNAHTNVITRSEFSESYNTINDLITSGPANTFCHNRLHILESRFKLHMLLNNDLEILAQKSVPHRDFYNVRKVDNHIHHSACMNQKHLLRYIKKKLKSDGDRIVIIRDSKQLTLNQVFESLNLTPYDLNVDTLDMHADRTFHRFDRFNLKYNPIGESRLREIFLKYNNYIHGIYLAELTKQVFDDIESSKYQFFEYRISIYGTDKNEWNVLAEWICINNLFHYNIRWMIQMPRLYRVYKTAGKLNNFADMLSNIFELLVQVSIDPQCNPMLHALLQQVVGFDMVDDESQREISYTSNLNDPHMWNDNNDPPYAYYCYYMYANLYTINSIRASKDLNTFSFRPHCGEAGSIDHLTAAFLTSQSINHGLQLHKSPALQYLYYLCQIGISCSPLSNNVLFLEYNKNPFPRFFARGLNVTLSTDDPLMIHVTREPLVEEYSVASQVWKLSGIDVCEIARNSVLQSGWEHKYKAHFVGNHYWIRSIDGNDIRQTNVPDLRIQFRSELLAEEHKLVASNANVEFDDTLIDPL